MIGLPDRPFEDKMRYSLLVRGTFSALSLALVSAPAAARHHHRHAAALVGRIEPAAIPPSQDAIDLTGIAPPTREATVEQTYGDAAYARARMQSRYPAEEASDAREAQTVGTPYPCDPHAATATSYVCRDAPARGYGQGYAFTPSYVSSPNVFLQDPSEQEPVMPAITGFFWAVNSARVDPH